MITTQEELDRLLALNDEDLGGPKGINLDLGEGNKWQFKDDAELSQNVKTVFTQVGQEVAKVKQQNAELETRLAQLQAQYNTNKTNEVHDDKDLNVKLNPDTFIDLMKQDPSKGIEYALQFGSFAKELKSAKEEATAARQELEADKFRRSNPEFPGGQFAQSLDQVRKYLNLPFTQDGLEASYAFGISKNVIPNFKYLQAQYMEGERQKQLQAQNPEGENGQYQNNVVPINNQQIDPKNWNGGFNFTPPSNRQGIPMPLKGGNQPLSMNNDQIESLSPQQLEKLISSLSGVKK